MFNGNISRYIASSLAFFVAGGEGFVGGGAYFVDDSLANAYFVDDATNDRYITG